MGKLALLLLAAALSAPAADPTLMKLAMPNARIVAGINVTPVRSSSFGQFMLSEFASAEGQDFQEFVAASGFDPRYDLEEILFVSPGGPKDNQKLLLARGRFNSAQIAELARSAGAGIETYQGVDILALGGQGMHGAHPGFLAFLGDSIAIAGDEQNVRAAIDRRQSGAGLGRELTDKVNALSGAQDAWFVSLVPFSELAFRVPDSNAGGALQAHPPKSIDEAGGGTTTPNSGVPSARDRRPRLFSLGAEAGGGTKTQNIGEVGFDVGLTSIDEASGGVKFGDLVKLSSTLMTRTAEDAKSLADGLRFLAGLALMQQPKPGQGGPSARDLLSALDLKAEGNTVKITLAIPEPQVEAFIRQARK